MHNIVNELIQQLDRFGSCARDCHIDYVLVVMQNSGADAILDAQKMSN